MYLSPLWLHPWPSQTVQRLVTCMTGLTAFPSLPSPFASEGEKESTLGASTRGGRTGHRPGCLPLSRASWEAFLPPGKRCPYEQLRPLWGQVRTLGPLPANACDPPTLQARSLYVHPKPMGGQGHTAEGCKLATLSVQGFKQEECQRYSAPGCKPWSLKAPPLMPCKRLTLKLPFRQLSQAGFEKRALRPLARSILQSDP